VTDAWADDQMSALGLTAGALRRGRVIPGELTAGVDPRDLRRGDSVLAEGMWVRVKADPEPAADVSGHQVVRVHVHRPDTGEEGYLLYGPGDTQVAVSRRAAGEPRAGAGTSVKWPDRARATAAADEIEHRLDRYPARTVATGVRPVLTALRAEITRPSPDVAKMERHLTRLSQALRSGGRDGPASDRGLAEAFTALADMADGLGFLQEEAHRGSWRELLHLRGGAPRVIPVADAATPEASRAATLAHEPIGKPGGPGVWGMKGAQYPAYFQHIRNDLIQAGHPEAEAHSLAWGIMRNFAAGHDGKGGTVSADTQAKATAAMAEMDKLRAQAQATRSTDMTVTEIPDATGLDASWDDLTGVEEALAGLTPEELEAAAADAGVAIPPGDIARAQQEPPAGPLGSGDRFAALAAKVKSKKLAAWIGHKKLGKPKMLALAAAARKRKAGPATRTASTGEMFRYWPLEECRILRAAEGREYESGRVVEAYAAVYDIPVVIKDHEGHYEEEIMRTAFDDILREIDPSRNKGFWNATCLYNHGMTVHGTPAERFSLPAGVPKHISSEGKGLLTRTEYAPTPLGDELLTLVDMGALRSQSFTGGIVRSDPPLRGPGDRYRRTMGGQLQRVKRWILGLREYGLTPFAAYTGAEVLGVRMQLPDGFGYADDAGPDPDADALAGHDGDGTGGPPEEGNASRSTGNRLYQLRAQEALERAGITLP